MLRILRDDRSSESIELRERSESIGILLAVIILLKQNLSKHNYPLISKLL